MIFHTLNKTQLGENKTTQNKGVVSTEMMKIGKVCSKKEQSYICFLITNGEAATVAEDPLNL